MYWLYVFGAINIALLKQGCFSWLLLVRKFWCHILIASDTSGAANTITGYLTKKDRERSLSWNRIVSVQVYNLLTYMLICLFKI